MKKFFCLPLVILFLAVNVQASDKEEKRKPASAKAVEVNGQAARSLYLALLGAGAIFNKIPDGSDVIYVSRLILTTFSEEGGDHPSVKSELSQDFREVAQRGGSARELEARIFEVFPKGPNSGKKIVIGPINCSRALAEKQEVSFDPVDSFKAIYNDGESADKLYHCTVDRK